MQTLLFFSIKVWLFGFDYYVVTTATDEHGNQRLLQVCPSFHPGMSHQIFKDEKIVGVKDPQIDIYFNPATCDVSFDFICLFIDVCYHSM